MRFGNSWMKGRCVLVACFLSAGATAQDISAYKDQPATLRHIADTTKNKKLKAEAYSSLGDYFQEHNRADSAISCKLESAKLKQEIVQMGDTSYRSSAGLELLGIAEMYLHMGIPQLAMRNTLEAKTYVKGNGYLTGIFYKYMGEGYRMMAQAGVMNMEKAESYYDSLTRHAETVYPPSWSTRLGLDLSFSDYYYSKKLEDKALEYIGRAKALAPKWADTTLQSQIMYMYSTAFVNRKDYSSAIKYLKEAEAMAGDWQPELYVNLVKQIADVYSAMGKWEDALAYYKKYVPLRDTLYRNATERSFFEAEAKFRNLQKQQQVERSELELSAARKQRLWLIGGLGLLFLAAILLFVIYRNKKRSARILDEKNKTLALLNNDLNEANKVKARLFSIIGHDLRSPISQVYQFLKLQQLNPQSLNEQQKNELSNKVQAATGSLLETMEDLLLWSKTQMSELKPAFQTVSLKETIKTTRDLLQLNSESRGISYKDSFEGPAHVTSDPYYLQTILRNLLQNAIKASPQNGLIRLGTTQTGTDTELYIENEGGLFTQQNYLQVIGNEENDKTLSGLGLRLVDELSKKIGVVVSFSTDRSATTRVSILFRAGKQINTVAS